MFDRNQSGTPLVRIVSGVVLGLAATLLSAPPASGANTGQLELRIVDADTGAPLAVRMHLRDARGKPVVPKKVVAWKDHFVFAGSTVLELPPGAYTFELERGPEYAIRRGSFSLKRGDQDSKQLDMKRFVDMSADGWYSGDLHVHRPLADIPLLMQAEDLHVAPVITWWNERNAWDQQPLPERTIKVLDESHFYDVMAGEDERGGGALLYFGLRQPLPITGSQREFPASVEFLRQAKEQPGVHVDIEKPFWWDVPIWLASGQVDSIGIAHNHMWRDGVLENEAWGRARDGLKYPAPHGNGRWTQDIYYHILNSGLRLPPSAGSASGVLPNPVGYNRVYVHVEGELTWKKWWDSLRQGQVVVTNGPLMRPLVNGQLPGTVFQAAEGESVELQAALTLSLREKVEYLELVKDGRTVQEVKLDEYAKAGGRLPPVRFDQSGWLMIRAVTNDPQTYRFAASGPFYVEIGGKPRISRSSVEFFLTWLDERAAQLSKNLADAEQQSRVLGYLDEARQFWRQRLAAANAD